MRYKALRHRGLRNAALVSGTLVSIIGAPAWGNDPIADIADAPIRKAAPPVEEHPCPRLKLSATRFAVDSIDHRPVPLTGGRLDVYPLSKRWMRGGIGLEGGTGKTSAVGSSINLTYGLLGLTVGAQYPARITPFVEAHFSGGVLSGRQDGTATVGGTTIMGASGTTWLYGRGIDVGGEFYLSGRVYISAAIGWMRATWGAPDFNAQVQNPQTPLRLVDINSDSLLWKLGIGI